MGVAGLWPLFEAFTTTCVFSRLFHGRTIGIDASVLLHRFASRDAVRVVLEHDYNGVAEALVDYVKQLAKEGISSVVVFDAIRGSKTFAFKAVEGTKRAEKRAAALAKAQASQRSDPNIQSYCRGAITLSPELVKTCIAALREERICYLIAPAEADHQLACLDREGKIDAVLSVDSDLVVHGCRRIIKYVNLDTDLCEVFCFGMFGCYQPTPTDNAVVSVLRRLDGNHRAQCIFLALFAGSAGCDYNKFAGVGIGTALSAFKQVLLSQPAVFSTTSLLGSTGVRTAAVAIASKLQVTNFTSSSVPANLLVRTVDGFMRGPAFSIGKQAVTTSWGGFDVMGYDPTLATIFCDASSSASSDAPLSAGTRASKRQADKAASSAAVAANTGQPAFSAAAQALGLEIDERVDVWKSGHGFLNFVIPDFLLQHI